MQTTALGLVATAAGVGVAHKLVRPYFKASVTCWFCAERCKVVYEDRNSWHCQSCGQYNGFNADGDYNAHIIGQHSEIPNKLSTRYARPVHSQQKSVPEEDENSNGLCESCNLNQELKIHQLRNFEPKNPANEDEEYEALSAHLDRAYRLCRNCEAKVRQVLGEQDSWLKPKLLSWKLELFRRSPLTSNATLSSEDLTLPATSRIFILFLAMLVTVASITTTKNASLTDSLPTLFASYLPKNFGYFELVTLVVPLALGSYYNSIIAVVNNKKHWGCILGWLGIFVTAVIERNQITAENSFRIFVALLNLATTTLVVLERPVSKKTKVAEKQKRKRKLIMEQEAAAQKASVLADEISNNPTPTNSNSPTPPSSSHNNTDLYLPDHEVFQRQAEAEPEETNQFDISTLKINANLNRNRVNPMLSPFSTKKYDAVDNKSNINFGGLGGMNMAMGSNSLMKPAKFVYNQRNRVAQSSWVAGGYWHTNTGKGNPHNGDNMSRSSSISSGIGSISSAAALQQQQQTLIGSLPNSRVNSTCGENFERFSVFSEPAAANVMSRPPTFGQPPNSVLNATIRTRSVLGDDDEDNNSFDSSLERLTQSAFDGLRPTAESSPKDKERLPGADKSNDNDISFLERKITFKISVYSVLLFFSIAFNVSLSLYFVTLYI